MGSQTGQANFQLLDDRIQVVEHPVGKFFLSQFVPDMLLGIQLGRVGRQHQQADVLRDDQIFGLVRTGPVQDHHDEIGRVCLADLGEELAHSHGVHLAAQPPIQLSFERAHRAIDICLGRGRDISRPIPPAEIPTSGTTAGGSYLG